MSLKTKNSMLKTNLKRTRIERSMRALNPSFERFDTAHIPAVVWNSGVRQGLTLPGWVKSRGLRGNTKIEETKPRSP
jgi:hypothetical protein